MKLLSKLILIILCLFASTAAIWGQSNLEVEGMGFLQNRALKSRLSFLLNLDADEPADLDSALLEDSAFLLIEQLKREGYMQPRIHARLWVDGVTQMVTWKRPYAIQLDADAVADKVVFEVEPGRMAYYEKVDIEGVSVIAPDELQRYFVPRGALVQTRRTKVYTPENLDRRIGRVLHALETMGYREARLAERRVELDAESGAAQVALIFAQGPRHYVGGLTLIQRKDGFERLEPVEVDENTVLTREWEQSLRSKYRNEAYAAGYPDAEVSIRLEEVAAADGSETSFFDGFIIADWGGPVTFGDVRFEGDEATSRSTLRRQLNLNKGEALDRLEVAEARRKIMGLGIYNRVDLAFDPPTGEVRDAVYILEPGVRQELNLLGGWGSYEQLRAGFKWEHRNPFGRAHRYELEVKQSMKSSRAELGYTIPQVFGPEMLLYANAGYDDREEIDFQRSSKGVSVGTSHTTPDGLRLTAEYGFFNENANREDGAVFDSEEDALVASLSFNLRYDRRDNFLAPGSGWSVFGGLKIANRWLGGTVDFQKLELGGSYHLPVSESTLLHLGLRAGTIFTDRESEKNIPFNERFFIGGENSVRGYQQGEASPLDTNGDSVGAETYALLNFELEQRVYSKFSLVLFSDSVFHVRESSLGEDGEVLSTLGLGLRYQTLVGPVRVEYGHNLNPRESDPDGTLHISIGFPF